MNDIDLIDQPDVRALILAERERATMVERERCANIANEVAWRGVRTRRYTDIPDEVAAAIRFGEEAGK